ncbi:hypothetical protein [Deinococcus radiodurans]|jgi:hypothetical protein|uniref:Lipoprotein n=1 Tax=Deinococcus radiodurans (strain ATCC 13939 / DSM 20539 / JCM 16871 / CCUG 27074 / LMG 4051 / NBRC 15346 / NCIMB 9279 / VKM B-1422 / R1) TaxID=243230 RepID=Q9RUA7_DEIRA|nr:hypothetical protein [Deinococcus radiodurans]AAF11062.1 hypothetical protein DR_1484 [Deinococcus radiodurans R1 = ATCC 13939 = DSM 20539]ANC71386.1 hypothetical protein A2G07_06150 [Deinococcus radiodurans R1 = ATCC 13939 = DSM 20539]QEM70930.1 hypothetical protein DXG80_03585 [Deinococcus radiodurans]UDL00585.1 hypothetical protein E5E91_07670 [Deinococcus radiodurans R1 = ATCC 13939 = DSM 20539]UID70462.1 hypothetical protein DRO_1466 [Deinococcus radiodurans R1 = ATCC 13939 = DSM 20539
MRLIYLQGMSPFARRAALLLTLPVLTGCTLGAKITPLTALEKQVNGLYEGVGSGPTGRVPYRLVLTVQPRGQQVSGVLTNLESRKAYALSGSYQAAGDALTLDTALFEKGEQHRGNLRGELKDGELNGQLRTVVFGKELLSYSLRLQRVTDAAAEPNEGTTRP